MYTLYIHIVYIHIHIVIYIHITNINIIYVIKNEYTYIYIYREREGSEAKLVIFLYNDKRLNYKRISLVILKINNKIRRMALNSKFTQYGHHLFF